MTLLLPDTNILSELVRVHANQKVLNRYYENLHQIGVAITVWHELWYGVYHMPEGRRQQMIADFINNNIARLPLYHYSKACADIHAKIRADCRKKAKHCPMPTVKLRLLRWQIKQYSSHATPMTFKTLMVL